MFEEELKTAVLGKTKIQVNIPNSETLPAVLLTEREAECLKHVMYGRSYKHIGRTLGISPRTVEFYINNMRTKFRCLNRYDLIEKVRCTDFLTNNVPSIRSVNIGDSILN